MLIDGEVGKPKHNEKPFDPFHRGVIVGQTKVSPIKLIMGLAVFMHIFKHIDATSTASTHCNDTSKLPPYLRDHIWPVKEMKTEELQLFWT